MWALNIADQVVDKPGGLLPADSLLLGIAIAGISEFGAVERKVDVLRETADGAKRFRE
jgi:hypothetical protein